MCRYGRDESAVRRTDARLRVSLAFAVSSRSVAGGGDDFRRYGCDVGNDGSRCCRVRWGVDVDDGGDDAAGRRAVRVLLHADLHRASRAATARVRVRVISSCGLRSGCRRSVWPGSPIDSSTDHATAATALAVLVFLVVRRLSVDTVEGSLPRVVSFAARIHAEVRGVPRVAVVICVPACCTVRSARAVAGRSCCCCSRSVS